MARPRTATKILELKGAHKKDPNRSRPNEPEGQGLFPQCAPEHLNSDQVRYWNEIKNLVPAGVLTGSDVLQVEICTYLLEQIREEYGRVSVSLIARFTTEINKLGLDPSGRAKLAIDKPSVNRFAT